MKTNIQKPEIIQAIKDLPHKAGLPAGRDRLAKHFGVTPSAMRSLLKKFKIKGSRSGLGNPDAAPTNPIQTPTKMKSNPDTSHIQNMPSEMALQFERLTNQTIARENETLRSSLAGKIEECYRLKDELQDKKHQIELYDQKKELEIEKIQIANNAEKKSGLSGIMSEVKPLINAENINALTGMLGMFKGIAMPAAIAGGVAANGMSIDLTGVDPNCAIIIRDFVNVIKQCDLQTVEHIVCSALFLGKPENHERMVAIYNEANTGGQ